MAKQIYSAIASLDGYLERTAIEREFDPQAVGQLKRSASRDITVGGPNVATRAFAGGLVDECHLFLMPILVGTGKRALPPGMRAALELLDERCLANGVVHLRYHVGA